MHAVPPSLLLLALLATLAGLQGAQGDPAPDISRAIEIAGRVEFLVRGGTRWLAATNGLELKPGDRLRTGPHSRAGIRFSDQSVMRLDERTILEIQMPRRSEKRRFRLPFGSLFFLHRDTPSDTEFETPVMSAAIRGTEFVLEVREATGSTRLALIDGAVDLQSTDGAMSLGSGEQASVEPGHPPTKSPILNIPALIQWALHYPAVIDLADLRLDAPDRQAMAAALEAYEAGDLLSADAAMHAVASGSPERELFRAAASLAVGRVEPAEAVIRRHPSHPVARALSRIIDLVTGAARPGTEADVPSTPSEWMARSYSLQAAFLLSAARDAAAEAVALSPGFAFAHVRLAELELGFERREAAGKLLRQALDLSPRLAQAHALQGFIALDTHDSDIALQAFERALALDASLTTAWLGRGLAQESLGRRQDALHSIQSAAALDPRRAELRSYLGKAYDASGEPLRAMKELGLAKNLDPADPTAWLYSALNLWHRNRLNPAVRDLERSVQLNDNRQLFRSRMLLDRDRAVRSASLAAVYQDAGLHEVSLLAASRAVVEDHANFSGHLFLANSYQALEDPGRYDLRYESVRLSELLIANLLAPMGAGNLSQILSQQESLRFFESQRFGASSLTEYRSSGSWRHLGTAFGRIERLSYALDIAHESGRGPSINDWRRSTDLSLQLKQGITARDELYVQGGLAYNDAGDVARHYSPAESKAGLHVHEEQMPRLFLGWHRAWSPASHTLLLVSRIRDNLHLTDPQASPLYFRPTVGGATSVSTPPGFDARFGSRFTLHSAELQQLWQTEDHTLVAGGRVQAGDVTSDGTLSRALTGVISDDRIQEAMRRANGYLYHHWHVAKPLRLTAGLTYDRLTYPRNSEIVPLTPGEATKALLAPKAGLLLTPWGGGQLRAAFTRSLGGLFFDSSVRLEPTQVGGFNQTFRSLLPESVAGLIPAATLDAASVGFDQSLGKGTYLGVDARWLGSDGERSVGVLADALPAPPPGSAASVEQRLAFRERSLSAYALQLMGDGVSMGVRYGLSESRLDTRFPAVPGSAAGLEALEQNERSVLHRVGVSLGYQHSSGLLAGWESAWHRQHNSGYAASRPGESLWQHNLWVGYRFPRRRAEVRFGLLNLADTDYRLVPLSPYAPLPRSRMLVGSVRLNF